MSIIRDINLQPFSNNNLFGEHPLVLPILLFSKLKLSGTLDNVTISLFSEFDLFRRC